MQRWQAMVGLNMSKTFCPLPWNHLATHPHGSVTLCCESEMGNRRSESFNRNDPESTRFDKRGFKTFQSTNYDFTKIVNSDSFNEVRLDMLNDRIPDPCKKCFEYEDAGVISKRQRELNRLPYTYEEAQSITNEDGSINKIDYQFIELRLGNHCNLACRSCNPSSSTRWIDDWEGYTNTPWKVDKALFEWPLNGDFWKKLGDVSSNKLEQLYINGGEPLLIDKHANYLEYLVENDYAKNINLYYSTNCTVKNNIYLDYWPHFKQVEFLLSIDDIEHRNHYIRYPSDWKKIIHTYEWFTDLRHKYDNIKISIMQTLSLYNIFYVDEFTDYFKKVDKYSYIHSNFVYAPKYLSPVNLPYEIKYLICNKLDDTERNLGIKKYLQNDGDINELRTFFQKTKVLDDIRKEDFYSVFPELVYYLKAYKFL